ncbi:MAG: PqqD family protein [Lachnospiraceae bacterium]|nr:PqqD family protein [Lachnospiraceae bacterium]
MKLKEGFITHESAGEQIMVAAGSAGFAGIVRSNQTAAFIVDCLKNDTTPERIVEAMAETYDAPREVIARDVEAILGKLRGIGALEE